MSPFICVPSVSSRCRRGEGTVTNSRKMQGIPRSAFPGRWSRGEDGAADSAEALRPGGVGSVQGLKSGHWCFSFTTAAPRPGKGAGRVLGRPAARAQCQRPESSLGGQPLQSPVAGSRAPPGRSPGPAHGTAPRLPWGARPGWTASKWLTGVTVKAVTTSNQICIYYEPFNLLRVSSSELEI